MRKTPPPNSAPDTQRHTAQAYPVTRRSSYRIHFKLPERPQIEVLLTPGLCRPAWIQNLSDTGAFLRLKGDHPAIASDSIIRCDIRCDIRLGSLELLGCEAIVRHKQYLAKLNESKLGLEFFQLSRAHSRQLHTLLMKLQRRHIRTDLTL
jgi:c-di-GMP-binding flagellar brake protein YcgR